MSKPYKGLICGTGSAGLYVGQVAEADGRATVAGMSDPVSNQLDKGKERFPEAAIGTDYYELLDRVEPNLVFVAGPDHLHAEQALSALDRGCHVLIEKPLATTVEDAHRLVEAQQRTGLQVMADHTARYLYPYHEMVLAARAGEIGQVFFTQGDYLHDMWAHYSPQGDRHTPWRIDSDNPQNILLGGGCHALDTMLWAINSPVEEVYGYSNKMSAPDFPADDCYILVLRFTNGVLGKIFVASGCSGDDWEKGGCGHIALYGTEGTLYQGMLSRRGEESQRLEEPAIDAAVGGHGWGRSVVDFLDAVEGKIDNPIPARVGANVVSVCAAAFEANRTGKPQQPHWF